MRRSIASLTVLLATAQIAHAQAVRGVVITTDSLFAPGVIVTLLSSNGTPVARSLSDDDGKFIMRAPSPGMYRIEARRLAYHVTVDEPIRLDSGKVTVRTVTLTGGHVQLAAMQATADPRCDANPDSTSAAFTLWEEARKALRASQLTRLTRAYLVDVTTFKETRTRGYGDQKRNVDSVLNRALPIRPFTSAPAEQLAREGYITRNARSAVFHAPDEDVLLSESFATTHCLRLLADTGDVRTARLGFSPVPDRKLPDIAGVISIDRGSSELRRLDFSFVNLPAMDVVGDPGGEIVFHRLPEGSWLIDQWAIWLPVSEIKEEASVYGQPSGRRDAVMRPTNQRFTTRYGLQTIGGRVTRVTFGNETIWMRTENPR